MLSGRTTQQITAQLKNTKINDENKVWLFGAIFLLPISLFQCCITEQKMIVFDSFLFYATDLDVLLALRLLENL